MIIVLADVQEQKSLRMQAERKLASAIQKLKTVRSLFDPSSYMMYRASPSRKLTRTP